MGDHAEQEVQNHIDSFSGVGRRIKEAKKKSVHLKLTKNQCGFIKEMLEGTVKNLKVMVWINNKNFSDDKKRLVRYNEKALEHINIIKQILGKMGS